MTMKHLLTICLILLNLNSLYSQSEFEKGYQSGFKKGYCNDVNSGCIPLSQDTPVPNLGESFDSYSDGFGRGFRDGSKMNDAGKSPTQSSNSTFNEVPVSMQVIPKVDLKALEESWVESLQDHATDIERELRYNRIQAEFEEELNNLRKSLNSTGNSAESYSNNNNENSKYSNRSTTDYNQYQNNNNSNLKSKANPVFVIFLVVLLIFFVVHMLNSNSGKSNKNNYRSQSNLSDNLILMFVLQYWGIFAITSIITHIWTVIIAFSEGGIISGLFTFIAPGISEIYWMIKMIGENNVFSIIAFVQLILSFLMLIIRKSNSPRY